MWNATHQVWYRYLHLVLCRSSLGVSQQKKNVASGYCISLIRECTRCSMTDALHISQTSMSACCPGSVRMLNVWTLKEATGAHVNQATCWTLKANTVSVSIVTLSSIHTSITSFKTVALFLHCTGIWWRYLLASTADKAVSDQKALCYRSASAGTCSLPLAQHITKQICCCSRVGKAWGAGCDRCPLPGSGTATKESLFLLLHVSLIVLHLLTHCLNSRLVIHLHP